MRKILIVDDSHSVRESLRMILKDSYDIAALGLGEESLVSAKTERIDLVILGCTYPLKEKTEFLHHLAEHNEDTAVLLMVEHQIQEEVSEFFDYAISDFITSPFSVYEVRKKIRGLLARRDAISSLSRVSHGIGKAPKYQRMFRSPLVEKRVANVLIKTLNNDLPVLIQGEYGAGHELMAKIIHYNGLRRKEEFFKLNCAGLPEESFIDFFLKTEGNGSHKRVGTLFLEEVERADPHIQMRLMEAIEEQAIASKNKEVSLNLRVIASAYGDLWEKVNNREFRGDLFYRLKAVPIILSPLRERRESIPMMADYFLEDLSRRMKLQRKKLSRNAAETLKNYYWPGNVLELESVVIRSAILTDEDIISEREISFGFEDIAAVVPPREDPTTYDAGIFDTGKEEIAIDPSLDTLVANLAHEVKNPLVAIKTFTQLLSERFEDAEFRGQFYKIVGENVDRIDSFIENIMDYTTFLNPNFQQVDVSSVIEKALMKNGGQSSEKESIIQKDFQNDLPPVWSDKDQLQYVFEGVLSKALHTVPGGKGLTMSAIVSGSESKEMSDLPGLEHTGDRTVQITIPLSHSKFAASSPEESPPILGLELYLAQRLVNRNLGVMEIRTTDEGGAVIEIRLPVACNDEQ